MAAPHFLDKKEARAEGRRRRGTQDPALGTLLVPHALGFVPAGVAVGGFWPLPGEIDVRPVLEALHGRGHPVLLPETPGRGLPLVFRAWRPGVAMRAERFGTLCPAEGAEGVPDLLLVPLLLFDAGCNRVGYGGGYYDRTIAALPGVLTLGCAFAAQEVDAVPVLPHDAPLHAVATERGLIVRGV